MQIMKNPTDRDEPLRSLSLLLDIRKARKGDATEVEDRQRRRLADLIAFARTNSPYYRELYRDLPRRVDDHTLLPLTNKQELMAHFDDWATDREVTFEKARAFVESSELIGERFLEKYHVAITSGIPPNVSSASPPGVSMAGCMSTATGSRSNLSRSITSQRRRPIFPRPRRS